MKYFEFLVVIESINQSHWLLGTSKVVGRIWKPRDGR
jgi:hypothetical protein